MKFFNFFLKNIFPPLLGFLLIYVAYNQFEPDQISEIKSYFKKADYYYIALSLIFAAIGYYSRAHRWLYSLEQMGYQVKFSHSFIAVGISYLLNLTIPRSGEVSRAGILSKTDNIPFQKSFGSIIAERVIDLIILLTITFIVILFKIDVALTLLPTNNNTLHTTITVLATIITLSILFFFILKHTGNRLIQFIKTKTSGLLIGLQSIYKLEQKKNFILHTAIIWCSYILMFYITIYSFKETSTLSFDQVLTAFIVGSFAVVFTNGGFGAYPYLIAKVLLLYSIPETIGTAFGWIVWSSQIILIILLGGISLLLLPFVKKKIQ